MNTLFTQDLFTSRKNKIVGNDRVGQIDRLWYDPITNSIRIGDGTPGGRLVMSTASTTQKGGVFVDGVTVTVNDEVLSVINGLYSTSRYHNPDWLVSLDYSKLLNVPETHTVGLLSKPTVTFDHDTETVFVSECIAYLCSANQYTLNTLGEITVVPAKSFSIHDLFQTNENLLFNTANDQYLGIQGGELLTDPTTLYVYATRDDIDSEYQVRTSKSLILAPNETLVCVAIKEKGLYHVYQEDTVGLGVGHKINELLIHKYGFETYSGLTLTANDHLTVTINSGIANHGVSLTQLPTVSSADDPISLYIRVNDGFVRIESSIANNQYYNDTDVGLALLLENRYTVNWFWRGVENKSHIYSVLSTSQYSNSQSAKNSKLPTVPDFIKNHTVFVGGIIYQKDDPYPVGYITPSEVGSGDQVLTSHNVFDGIQGGKIDEHYHLSKDQHDILVGVVNGTHIKTINGESVIGSGDIKVVQALTHDLLLTVGEFGDFDTLNEALAYASTYTVGYTNNGVDIEIKLLDDYVMKEQILVRGISLSHITISGDSEYTTIDGEYLTTEFDTEAYPAFACNRGELPTINQLFKMINSSNKTGMYLTNTSKVVISPGAGIENAGKYGLYVGKVSIAVADYSKFRKINGVNSDQDFAVYSGGMVTAKYAEGGDTAAMSYVGDNTGIIYREADWEW